MPPELQKRKATVIAELRALVISRKELANGYRYGFAATDNILDKLASFIETEKICCDFFNFYLTVEQNTTLLTITGADGTKKFLKEELNF